MSDTALARAEPLLPSLQIETRSVPLVEFCGALVKSGYFKDLKDVSQAIVKVAYGQELGLPPIASIMGIHIIEGKPALGSNVCASIVKRSGKYNYRVRETSPTICSVEFFEAGQSCGKITWTWEDAQRAGLVGKDNWRKYPRQMLFGRCMTEGIRMFCPDLTAGPPIYTPEELGEERTDEFGAPLPTPAEPQKTLRDVIEAGAERAAARPSTIDAMETAQSFSGDRGLNGMENTADNRNQQRKRLQGLMTEQGLETSPAGVLALMSEALGRTVTRVSSLTAQEWASVCDRLERQQAAVDHEAETAVATTDEQPEPAADGVLPLAVDDDPFGDE